MFWLGIEPGSGSREEAIWLEVGWPGLGGR